MGFELLSPSQRINKEYYVTVLKSLKDAVCFKLSELCQIVHGFCIKIIAVSSSSNSAGLFDQTPRNTIEQSPYSLRWLFNTCDFFLFP